MLKIKNPNIDQLGNVIDGGLLSYFEYSGKEPYMEYVEKAMANLREECKNECVGITVKDEEEPFKWTTNHIIDFGYFVKYWNKSEDEMFYIVQKFIEQKKFDALGHSYRPLIKGLTIADSEIEGVGLFAKCNFPTNFNFGIGYYIVPVSHEGYWKCNNNLIRTPLAGFINHNEEANLKLVRNANETYSVVSIKSIDAGDELTLDYRLTPCLDATSCEDVIADTLKKIRNI